MNFIRLLSNSVARSSQSDLGSQKVHEFDSLNDDNKVKRLFDENQKLKISINRFIRQSNKAQIEPLSLDSDLGTDGSNRLVRFSIETEDAELKLSQSKELKKLDKLEIGAFQTVQPQEEDRPSVKHRTISNFNTAFVKKKLSERLNNWRSEMVDFDEMMQTPQFKSVVNEIARKKRHSYTKGADSKRPRIFEMDNGSHKIKPTVKLSLDEMKEFKNNVLQISKEQEAELSPKEDSDIDDRELFIFNNVYDSFSDDELENMQGGYIIHPNSYFQKYSDLVVCFSLLVMLFFTPLCAAFDYSGLIITALDVFIDIIFTFDVIIGFFKAFHDKEDNLIFNRRKIIVHYLLSYFIFDFIAALPFNTLISVGLIKTYDVLWLSLRFIRLFKAMKAVALRPFRAIKKIVPKRLRLLWRRKVGSFSIMWKNFYKYLFIFIIILHILTCFWIYLGHLDPEINWFMLIKEGMGDRDLYIASFYFNMFTLYTVGYGDIHPVSLIERLYNILLLILALIIYSFIVSFLSKFAIESDPVRIKLTQNVEYLDDITIKHAISYKLSAKIRRFLMYNHRANSNGKNEFLFELPSNLRNELICNMYKRIINNFIFFKKTSNQDFNARVLLALRPVKAFKHEKLIKQDDFIDEIILVRKGKLQITCEYKDFIIKLIDICKNEHFGDVLMLTNERCPVTVRARSSTCELYLLRKFDLMNIFVDFEEIFKVIFNNSSFNMMQLKKIIKVKRELIDHGLHLSNSYDFTRKVSSINDSKSEGTTKNKNHEFNTIIMEEDEEEGGTLSPRKLSTKKGFKNSELVSGAKLNKYLREQNDFVKRASGKKPTININNFFKEDSNEGEVTNNITNQTEIKPVDIIQIDSDKHIDSDNLSIDSPVNNMKSLHLGENFNVTGNINSTSQNVSLGRKSYQINNNNHINIILNNHHSDGDNRDKPNNKYVNISLNVKVENNFHIIKKGSSDSDTAGMISRKRSKSINRSVDSSDIEKRFTKIKQAHDSSKQLLSVNVGKRNSFYVNNNTISSASNSNQGCFVNNTVIFHNKTMLKRKANRCSTTLNDFTEDSIKEKIKSTSKKDIVQIKNKTREIYNEIEKNIKAVSMHQGIDDIFNQLCEQLNRVDQGFLNKRLDSLYSKLEKVIY
jgi:hypothetical protein